MHSAAHRVCWRCGQLSYCGAGVSPILESPEAAGSENADAGPLCETPSDSASPAQAASFGDATLETGIGLVAAEAASCPSSGLSDGNGLPLAALAAVSLEPARNLSPLQRLLALCGQVWKFEPMFDHIRYRPELAR